MLTRIRGVGMLPPCIFRLPRMGQPSAAMDAVGTFWCLEPAVGAVYHGTLLDTNGTTSHRSHTERFRHGLTIRKQGEQFRLAYCGPKNRDAAQLDCRGAPCSLTTASLGIDR